MTAPSVEERLYGVRELHMAGEDVSAFLSDASRIVARFAFDRIHIVANDEAVATDARRVERHRKGDDDVAGGFHYCVRRWPKRGNSRVGLRWIDRCRTVRAGSQGTGCSATMRTLQHVYHSHPPQQLRRCVTAPDTTSPLARPMWHG